MTGASPKGGRPKSTMGLLQCKGTPRYCKGFTLSLIGFSALFVFFSQQSTEVSEGTLFKERNILEEVHNAGINKPALTSIEAPVRKFVMPNVSSHITDDHQHSNIKNEDVDPSLFMTKVNLQPEKELATLGGPMDYLPDYQNPCWMSSYKDPKPGINPYQNSPYIMKWIKKFVWGKEWMPMFRSFMNNMTERVTKGENWRVRCTPGLYLIGSSKSGTDDLYFKMIRYHPDVHKPAVKEPEWWVHGRFGPYSYSQYIDGFDRSAELIRQKKVIRNGKEYHPGYAIDASSWYIYSHDYARRLPGNRGEKTPKYLMAHAVKALHPGTKIMAIIREPGARLYSQYRMKYKNQKAEHFDAKARETVESWKRCIKENGLRHCVYRRLDGNEASTGMFMRASLYYPFLRDWIEVMGRKNVYVVRAEDYYADRINSLQDVFKFLELDPLTDAAIDEINKSSVSNTKTEWGRSTVKMLNSTKNYLDDFFRPYNQQLAELLNDKRFLWEGY